MPGCGGYIPCPPDMPSLLPETLRGEQSQEACFHTYSYKTRWIFANDMNIGRNSHNSFRCVDILKYLIDKYNLKS